MVLVQDQLLKPDELVLPLMAVHDRRDDRALVLKKDGLGSLEGSLDQSSDRSENVTGVLVDKLQIRTVLPQHPRGLHDSRTPVTSPGHDDLLDVSEQGLVQASPPAGAEVLEALQDRVLHEPALVLVHRVLAETVLAQQSHL